MRFTKTALLVATLAATIGNMEQAAASTDCAEGILVNSLRICCDASCEACGSSDTCNFSSITETQRDLCCYGRISDKHGVCSATVDAPCNMRGGPTSSSSTPMGGTPTPTSEETTPTPVETTPTPVETTPTPTSTTSTTLPDGVNMISVTGGTYTMGSESINGISNAAEHTVTVSDFTISDTEVTNAQFVQYLNEAQAHGMLDSVTGVTGTWLTAGADHTYAGQKLYQIDGSRVMKDHDNDGSAIDPENPLNMAMIEQLADGTFQCVDPQAIDWVNWEYHADTGETMSDWPELSNPPSQADVCSWAVGFVQYYGALSFANHYGLTLPSEAQWEYAARGGSANYDYATADGQISASQANYNENDAHPDRNHVEAVKTYDPNPLGLYDMSGNVWEWCLDWYTESEFYASSDGATDPVNNSGTEVPEETTACRGGPQEEYTCATRVRRGGSWNYHSATLAAAYRAPDLHWRGNDHFGFRVAGTASSGGAFNDDTRDVDGEEGEEDDEEDDVDEEGMMNNNMNGEEDLSSATSVSPATLIAGAVACVVAALAM